MARPDPPHAWAPGTECVGKYNFPGSASHVSVSSTKTILYSCSVDPPEVVCRRKILHSTYVQYAILHLWYSTANFLVLEPTALIYIYIKNGAVTRIYVVLEKKFIEQIIR